MSDAGSAQKKKKLKKKQQNSAMHKAFGGAVELANAKKRKNDEAPELQGEKALYGLSMSVEMELKWLSTVESENATSFTSLGRFSLEANAPPEVVLERLSYASIRHHGGCLHYIRCISVSITH